MILLCQLGALAISAALDRAGCPREAVDEVYMGAVLQVSCWVRSIYQVCWLVMAVDMVSLVSWSYMLDIS